MTGDAARPGQMRNLKGGSPGTSCLDVGGPPQFSHPGVHAPGCLHAGPGTLQIRSSAATSASTAPEIWAPRSAGSCRAHTARPRLRSQTLAGSALVATARMGAPAVTSPVAIGCTEANFLPFNTITGVTIE